LRAELSLHLGHSIDLVDEHFIDPDVRANIAHEYRQVVQPIKSTSPRLPGPVGHLEDLMLLAASVKTDQVDLRQPLFDTMAVIDKVRKRAREEPHAQDVSVAPLHRRSCRWALFDAAVYRSETVQKVLELLLTAVLGEPIDPLVHCRDERWSRKKNGH